MAWDHLQHVQLTLVQQCVTKYPWMEFRSMGGRRVRVSFTYD